MTLRKRVFESGSGTSFDPYRDLPKDTLIVYKVPALADADESGLSKPEKELRRYMQVILPQGVSPQDFVEIVRGMAERRRGLGRPGRQPAGRQVTGRTTAACEREH